MIQNYSSYYLCNDLLIIVLHIVAVREVGTLSLVLSNHVRHGMLGWPPKATSIVDPDHTTRSCAVRLQSFGNQQRAEIC